MINANDEPEAVGLKKSFGSLISHCRKHPNLNLVHLITKRKSICSPREH